MPADAPGFRQVGPIRGVCDDGLVCLFRPQMQTATRVAVLCRQLSRPLGRWGRKRKAPLTHGQGGAVVCVVQVYVACADGPRGRAVGWVFNLAEVGPENRTTVLALAGHQVGHVPP